PLSPHADDFLVDEQPLIFFSLHRLRQIEGWIYDPRLTDFKTKASTVVRRRIYAPYIRTLAETAQCVPPSLRDAALRSGIRYAPAESREHALLRLKQWLGFLLGVLKQDYLLVLNG